MAALDAARAQAVLLEYLQSLRHKKSTIRTKTAYLKGFLHFLRRERTTDLREVSSAQIQRYLEAQASAICPRTGRPYSPSSLLLFHGAVRLLFAALYQAQLVLTNPARELSFRPSQRNTLRSVFSQREIAQFLDSIDIAAARGLRDRALFELMYSSGLRSGEVGKLDRGDVDLQQRMLIVREAKWGKDRLVPVSAVAAAFLSRYLQGRADPRQPVFLGQRGRMTTGGVAFRFHQHLTQAGLAGKGLTPHSIRRATATHLLAHGADLRYVQELLGHESIETTVLYTNELLENLKRIYRRFHPRENELYREVDAEYRARVGRLIARLEDPRRLAQKARRHRG